MFDHGLADVLMLPAQHIVPPAFACLLPLGWAQYMLSSFSFSFRLIGSSPMPIYFLVDINLLMF